MEENYKSKVGINQSSIKDWGVKSPADWKRIYIDGEKDEDKNDEVFTFGSLVDYLAFSDQPIEEKFYVDVNSSKISEEESSIVHNVYNIINYKNNEIDFLNNSGVPEQTPLLEIGLEINRNILEEVINSTEWRNNWGLEAKVKRILNVGESYIKKLHESKGKNIITQEDLDRARETVQVLRNHPRSKKYFTESDRYKLFFQIEIYDIFNVTNGSSIRRKGALDIVIVDLKEKTIQLADLKTTFSCHNFIFTIKKFGYLTQVSYYNSLLRNNIKKLFPDYEDFTFLDPINITIDGKMVPHIFKYKSIDLEIAKQGNDSPLKYPYKIVKGWMEKLSEISWHLENDIWDEPKELFENGEIIVNLQN